MSKDLLAQWAALDDTPDIREGYLRSPFSYPGNKMDSLPHILPRLPYANTFVEVFGGSGAVTLNRRASNLDVYNDRYGGVVSFFRCVRNPVLLDSLVQRIALSPHAREEFFWARENWENTDDDVERAARWYVSVQSSFAGRGEYFGRVVKGKGLIWTKIQNNLDLFQPIAQRFLTIQIENLDWRNCLKDYDSEDTVFYLDPPYIGHNIYKFGMSIKDHIEMCERIFQLKGYVALSGYANDVYDRFPWDSKHEWEVKDMMTTQAFTTETSAVHGKENIINRGKQIEMLWIKECG